MIKTATFIQTFGTKNFKKFLETPFNINMLYPIDENNNTKVLFDYWKGKNMINWYKFINDDKTVIEFYPTHYVLIKNDSNSTKYTLLNPKTINDFINDMDRFDVQLFWTDLIDIILEPKDYLNKEQIKTYYVNLLEKMNKSNELI